MTVSTASKILNDTLNESIDSDEKSIKMGWCSSNWRALVAEVISTAFLMFFGCMACIPPNGFIALPAMYAEISFGLVVLFNIQAFGHISGAHMNPAVTFASVIWGDTSLVLAVLYLFAQCLGSTLGYGLLVMLSPINMSKDAVCVTGLRVGLTTLQGFGIEVMLTAMLVFVCCGVWDAANAHKQDSTALKFGFTIAALSLAGGPMTGASMNPARSLSPALWNGAWANHWIYWLGPFVGSGLAVTIYKVFLLKPTPNAIKDPSRSKCFII